MDVSLLNLSVVSSIFLSASSRFFFLDRVSTALKGTGSSETNISGKISNDDVSVLRDTGCSTVFVHSKFTNTDHLTGHARDICLADGTVKQCPEVYINVSPPFISGDIVALILDTPFADLVVDNYVNTSVPHSNDQC
jgi:hypothetical protein